LEDEMADQVVHFEIIGTHPAQLREYYGELFGWQYDVGDTSSALVSEAGRYGFVTGEGGPNGGVGGGPSLQPQVVFYIGVPDVGAALARAVELGGTAVLGPDGKAGQLIVAHFTDPEGNLIGLAGPK
jgi:predicted enzyme related to lactoylglutathione lyase